MKQDIDIVENKDNFLKIINDVEILHFECLKKQVKILKENIKINYIIFYFLQENFCIKQFLKEYIFEINQNNIISDKKFLKYANDTIENLNKDFWDINTTNWCNILFNHIIIPFENIWWNLIKYKKKYIAIEPIKKNKSFSYIIKYYFKKFF